MLTWLTNRWNEPETRAFAAMIVPTLAAYGAGKIDLTSLLLALAAQILGIVFPSTKGSN